MHKVKNGLTPMYLMDLFQHWKGLQVAVLSHCNSWQAFNWLFRTTNLGKVYNKKGKDNHIGDRIQSDDIKE